MRFNCAYVELVELHKLVENPKNPNKHPAKQIEMLAKIIDFQGQRAPIVVSKRSGFIVKGHGRLAAIKSLGWEKAAVDFQDYESEAQEFADMVADNKVSELSFYNEQMVVDTINNLGIQDFDFELLGLKDFSFDSASKAIEVNKGDENSAWVGMPDFETAEPYVKLILQFNTELERELYVQANQIQIDRKMNNQWISYQSKDESDTQST